MSETLSRVQLLGVTKLFGAIRAVADVSLTVEPGQIVAVMGPNGAGKSTLLSLLSLSVWPSAGEVRFNDRPVGPAQTTWLGHIGLLSHQPLVYPDLTVKENLILFARLHGLPNPKSVVQETMEQLGLGPILADRVARVLSRGQLQRLALARALIAQPRLLLLDEPATGLDGDAVARIERVLEKLAAAGGLAVMVTHEPELAARVATHLLVMNNGAIVATGSPGSADHCRDLYQRAIDGGVR